MVKSVLVILTILGCIIWSMEENITKITSPINITDDPVIDTGNPIDLKTNTMLEEFFENEKDVDVDDVPEIDLESIDEGQRDEDLEKGLNMFFFGITDPTLQEDLEHMNRLAFIYESMMAAKNKAKTNSATSGTSTVVPTTEPTAEPVVPTTEPTTAYTQNPMLNN